MAIPYTTLTDANGYYEFTGLAPGDYSIVIKHPDGYIPAVDTAGSKGGLVVNRYANIDAITMSTLAVDPQGSAIVKIALNSGDTAVHNNFSLVKVNEIPPEIRRYIPIHQRRRPRCLAYPSCPIRCTMAWLIPLPPIIMPQQLMGGSGGPPGYTWHLSVINGGQPRKLQNGVGVRRQCTIATFRSRILDRGGCESRWNLDHRRLERRAGEKISLRHAWRNARYWRLERRRRHENRRVHQRPMVP